MKLAVREHQKWHFFKEWLQGNISLGPLEIGVIFTKVACSQIIPQSSDRQLGQNMSFLPSSCAVYYNY
jgi:hypothetical protein